MGVEYRGESDEDLYLWELRAFFLQKVAELAPEVLEDLQADVLPAYQQAYEATQPPPKRVASESPWGEVVTRERQPDWVHWRFEDGDWEGGSDWSEQLDGVYEALESWANAWNLYEPWALDAALRTLFIWHRKEVSPDNVLERLESWKTLYSSDAVKHEFASRDLQSALEALDTRNTIRPLLRFYPRRFTEVVDAPPFRFEFDGWAPQHQPWEVYEKELRVAFEEQLETYEQERREGPEDRGLDAPREIRAPRHFEWLVLWQVQEKSYDKIAAEYDNVSTYKTPTGSSSSAVRQGVHDKARRIGLTRRTQ